MKNLTLLLTFAVAFLLSAGDLKAQNHGSMGSDTLTTSGSLDTATQYIASTNPLFSQDLTKGGRVKEVEIAGRIDSLSGATNATVYVEYSNSITRPPENDVSWYSPGGVTSSYTVNGVTTVGTASSFTVNGVLTKFTVKDLNFNASWARVRLTQTGTQSNRLRDWYGVVRN